MVTPHLAVQPESARRNHQVERYREFEIVIPSDPRPSELMPNTISNFDRGIVFLGRHKVLLLVLASVGGLAGFALSYCFTPQYKADAVLVPSDEILGLSENGGLGSLGGLASLVGVGAPGSKENEAVETLKSRALTRSFIEANGILPIIFHDRWDSAARKWKVDKLGRVPTLEDGFRKFDKNILTVVENHKTGLITISITWEDPVLATQWTAGLVDAANDRLRTQAVARSTRTLEYLEKVSATMSITEVKASIYKLIESEIKKQMIASGGKDYAFRVVDPPVVPERKVFPARSLFLVFGALIVPAIGSLILALRRHNGGVAR
jgi:uncharacterized protein involved in exopolysaccharide biosynthesis